MSETLTCKCYDSQSRLLFPVLVKVRKVKPPYVLFSAISRIDGLQYRFFVPQVYCVLAQGTLANPKKIYREILLKFLLSALLRLGLCSACVDGQGSLLHSERGTPTLTWKHSAKNFFLLPSLRVCAKWQVNFRLLHKLCLLRAAYGSWRGGRSTCGGVGDIYGPPVAIHPGTQPLTLTRPVSDLQCVCVAFLKFHLSQSKATHVLEPVPTATKSCNSKWNKEAQQGLPKGDDYSV